MEGARGLYRGPKSGTLDNVLQVADIARPIVRVEEFHRLHVDTTVEFQVSPSRFYHHRHRAFVVADGPLDKWI
jgi:hypothetical protein